MNNRLATLATIDALNEYIEDVRKVVLAASATLHDLIDHIEDVRQVVLSIDRRTARRLDAFGDPDTHYGAAARDAIFNLERALDSALADARNTLADARNTIRQATEPTT